MKTLQKLAFALITITSITGCFEPIQSGGVVIVGDPAERLGVLCRFKQGGSFCGSEAYAADLPAADAPATEDESEEVLSPEPRTPKAR